MSASHPHIKNSKQTPPPTQDPSSYRGPLLPPRTPPPTVGQPPQASSQSSKPAPISPSAHTNCLPLSRNVQPEGTGLSRGTGLPPVVSVTAGRDSGRRFGWSFALPSQMLAWLSPSASDLLPDDSPRRSSRLCPGWKADCVPSLLFFLPTPTSIKLTNSQCGADVASDVGITTPFERKKQVQKGPKA